MPDTPALAGSRRQIDMWPTDSVWGNALLFAAAGYGFVAAAALGSVLGRSSRGRRFLMAAPLALGGLLAAYIAASLLTATANKPSEQNCIYSDEHPSDCSS